jgi:DNA polymerase-3 subunit alpha
MEALNRTEHGRVTSLLDHIDCCNLPQEHDNPLDPGNKRSRDEQIKPICGMEGYWRDNRFDKEIKASKANHLCVTAVDLNGWHNLIRLHNATWVRIANGGGYRNKPCFDWELLERYRQGLAIGTACIGSPVAELILVGDLLGARAWLKRMQALMEGRLWVEIMPHDLPQQRTVNIELAKLAHDLSLPLIATGDVHIPYPEWARTHSILRMISWGSDVEKEERKSESGEEIYTEETHTAALVDGAERRRQFQEFHPDLSLSIVDEALTNTVEFARSVRPYVLSRSSKMPRLSRDDDEAYNVLLELCEKRLAELQDIYPPDHWDETPVEMYRQRHLYELGVLRDKGSLDQYRLLHRGVCWARSSDPLPPTPEDPDPQPRRPIIVNARGSAAGSLVAYEIGITTVDPMRWGFLFERFLNPDREDYPDIDLDVEAKLPIINGMDGRALLKEFYRRTYGADRVSDIIAPSTFGPRSIIEAVAKVFQIPVYEVQKVNAALGDTDRDLDELVEQIPELAEFRDRHQEAWEHAVRLEGQRKGDSRHAGGLVVMDCPLDDVCATMLATKDDGGGLVTAWTDTPSSPVFSRLGFIKNDVLGVRALTKFHIYQEWIEKVYGEKVDLQDPRVIKPLRDPHDVDEDVMQAFSRGDTLGVFQFNTDKSVGLLRRMQPRDAMDLAVHNAIIRPGPDLSEPEYLRRRRGQVPEDQWYWHDSVKPILKDTLGIVVFQEQLMKVCQALGGFTGGEADIMRKAAAKLYRQSPEVAAASMEKFVSKFMANATAKIGAEMAQLVWQKIIEFARYSFNLSHSGTYACHGYTDEFVKTRWPLAFYPAVLTIDKIEAKERDDVMKAILADARGHGVDTRAPSVNSSDMSWTIDDGAMRFGLGSIGGLGANKAPKVMNASPYADLDDFFARSKLDIGAMTALARAGALDGLADRAHLLSRAKRWGNDTRRSKLTVNYTCGCQKRSVTVETTPKDVQALWDDGMRELTWDQAHEEYVERAIRERRCPAHGHGEIDAYEVEDDTYTVLEYLKDKAAIDKENAERVFLAQETKRNPRLKPFHELTIVSVPSEDDLHGWEMEALSVDLRRMEKVALLEPLIGERVHLPDEIDAMPASPDHKRGCGCDECQASRVVIGGEVAAMKPFKVKNGQNKGKYMGRIAIKIGNATYDDVLLFSGAWSKFSQTLHDSAAVIAEGHKNDRGTIVVDYVMDAAKLLPQVKEAA